jgi:hypothetical protein
MASSQMDPIPYIVHNFWIGPIGLRLKVVHYVGKSSALCREKGVIWDVGYVSTSNSLINAYLIMEPVLASGISWLLMTRTPCLLTLVWDFVLFNQTPVSLSLLFYRLSLYCLSLLLPSVYTVSLSLSLFFYLLSLSLLFYLLSLSTEDNRHKLQRTIDTSHRGQ